MCLEHFPCHVLQYSIKSRRRNLTEMIYGVKIRETLTFPQPSKHSTDDSLQFVTVAMDSGKLHICTRDTYLLCLQLKLL